MRTREKVLGFVLVVCAATCFALMFMLPVYDKPDYHLAHALALLFMILGFLILITGHLFMNLCRLYSTLAKVRSQYSYSKTIEFLDDIPEVVGRAKEIKEAERQKRLADARAGHGDLHLNPRIPRS